MVFYGDANGDGVILVMLNLALLVERMVGKFK